MVDLRHWHLSIGQCRQHPIFPIHRMGRLEQLPRRFAPQHIFTTGRRNFKCRIRLPTGKLLRRQWPLKTSHLVLEIICQLGHIKIKICLHAQVLYLGFAAGIAFNNLLAQRHLMHLIRAIGLATPARIVVALRHAVIFG